MVPKGKPMKLRNKQRTAVEDAIDHDPDHLLQQSEQVLLVSFRQACVRACYATE
jgi:hypothetical protein